MTSEEVTPSGPARRKQLSKRLRFSVLTRDDFQCRYCGRSSDVAVLHVDHIIPVSRNGPNDIDNLITACADCNLGKAARSPVYHAPTPQDAARLAASRRDQQKAARAALAARTAREDLRQEVLAFWCNLRQTDSIDKSTLSVMVSYVHKHGAREVFRWIETAINRSKASWSDNKIGRYISGIRKQALEGE